jgi:hypothetical protein
MAFLTRTSSRLAGLQHLQLGNAFVGTAKPPTKLAIDVLHDKHIAVNVGFVVGIELPGRKLVEHGWALRDDGG